LRCNDSHDGFNNDVRAVKLNVVTAAFRHYETALRGKHGKLLLQAHHGSLPVLEIGSMIRRSDDAEWNIRKRTGTFDLLVAFRNPLFLEIGSSSRLKARACFQLARRVRT